VYQFGRCPTLYGSGFFSAWPPLSPSVLHAAPAAGDFWGCSGDVAAVRASREAGEGPQGSGLSGLPRLAWRAALSRATQQGTWLPRLRTAAGSAADASVPEGTQGAQGQQLLLEGLQGMVVLAPQLPLWVPATGQARDSREPWQTRSSGRGSSVPTCQAPGLATWDPADAFRRPAAVASCGTGSGAGVAAASRRTPCTWFVPAVDDSNSTLHDSVCLSSCTQATFQTVLTTTVAWHLLGFHARSALAMVIIRSGDWHIGRVLRRDLVTLRNPRTGRPIPRRGVWVWGISW
jgi:hypothetical protein